MSLKLSEDTVGIWAVDLMNGSDYLAALWREDDVYVMEYRFRYYVDDKTFDSDDKKNWYRAEIPTAGAEEDDLIRAQRMAVEMMWKASGGSRYELMMGPGGIKEMMADLKKWPMITMQTLTKQQAEERGL